MSVSFLLERAVRLELTILELQSSALAAWRRALILYFVFCASLFEVFTSEARDHKHQRTKHKVQSTALYGLERKERFELSKRVWKTRMFPATSLPQSLELLAGFEPATSTFEASRSSSCATGARMNFGLRISDCGFEQRNDYVGLR